MMKKINRRNYPRLTLCVILLGITSSIFAPALFAQGGATGFDFLKLGIGGRNVAMADAGVVSSVGGASIHYNPANMLQQESAQIFFMHNSWVQDLSTEYIGATVPFGDLAIGFHVNTTRVPDIEIRNVPGPPIGAFDARDLSTGISAAVRVANDVSVGITAKYILEKLYTEYIDGYAFDFGVHYQTTIPNLSASVALANIGSMGELRNETIKLPTLIRIGAAYSYPVESINGSILIEANAIDVFAEKKFHAHVGVEAAYEKSIFARLGYQQGYETKSISAGIGAAYGQFLFDYGFTPFQNDLGTSHTISFAYQL